MIIEDLHFARGKPQPVARSGGNGGGVGGMGSGAARFFSLPKSYKARDLNQTMG